MIAIEMQGVGALAGRIARLSEAAASEVDRELYASALAIEAGAKRRAPVDTGRLRASIRHVRPGPLDYAVLTDVGYGRWVELGTRRTPAQPFMRPAAMEERANLVARLREVFRDANRSGAVGRGVTA